MAHIIVDQDRCTGCGVCVKVCPSGIIDLAGEAHLPQVKDENILRCLYCGHCEAFCPSEALVLNLRPDEKVPLPAGAGTISPEDMAFYLKKRRSVRHFTGEPVPREKILEVLDIARYAASGTNGQPVQWLVVHDPEKVRKIAGLTIEWMKSLINTSHPMSGYVPALISAWEQGIDVICRNAPHMLFAHIPEGNPIAPVDAIIALTHFDIAAPAFGIGTCWAGFVAAASMFYEPLQKELGLPAGRKFAYAMMFGNPKYKVCGIPRRKPLEVTWQ
ncbi:4Fe-4S dicluster domain-containing protein [Methanosarcina sp. KYL-1]|uniref:nitroreductase family protein n=1 Tax=Methanosarcina sp. KYL-1 TaxID=2602068 RepID=UPI00210132F6|nr:nitroreductase family protein [Methanosarcina sp. KYL-1]MCQ1536806.1 4Fe-4S dicluster domain-containing protein [Methanosarcina sp. KYL-1]